MRGRPFEPGVSPNPAGRPKGRRNRATEALEQILDGDAETIMRAVIRLAQEGDATAMKLCVDRLLPIRKDRTVQFELPPIETAADLTKATEALLQGVADGALTPAEAGDLAKMVQAHIEAIRTVDFAERLAAIEAAENQGGQS